MLMALLPLVGWAADIQDVAFVAKNVVYGTSSTATALVTVPTGFSTDDYSISGFCDENKADLTATNTNQLDAGTYYVKIVGDGNYNGTTGYFKFIVNPLDLEGATVSDFTAKDFTGSAVTYADADFTGKVTFTTPSLTLVKDEDYTVTYANNTNAKASDAATDAPTITFTAMGTNFTGSKTKTFTIKPVTLVLEGTDANATATLVTTEYTYNGDDQKTEVTVAAKTGAPTLTADDYTISYDSDTKNAGTYTVKIEGKNNWTTTTALTVGTVTIKPATLFVEANATRKYDDATGWSTLTKDDVDLTYVGWLGDDETTIGATGITVSGSAIADVYTLADADIKNAGDETRITIDDTKFSISGNTNYSFKGKSTGKLTITKADTPTITFSSELTKDKGTTPTLAEVKTVLTITPTTAADAIKEAVTGFAIGTEADTDGKYEITLTVDTDADVFANYDMDVFEAGKGKIKYNNATLYISLKTASLSKLTKVYDGAEPDLSGITAADFDIDGWVEGEETDLTITAAFATGTDHKNVANYVLNFTVEGVPAGYNQEVGAATYKVTARPVTITINTQYLADNDAIDGDAPVFDNTLFTVANLAETDTDKDEIFALDLQDNFKNSGTPATFKADGATTEIPLTKAIKVIAADATLAANYSGWDTATGAVNVAGGTTLVLDEKADLTGVIASNVTINFTNARTLQPKRWYAMCLPFETTVAKISAALGYAIVDVLPEDATALNFKIAMGTIEAYRPFLVKIADGANVNMNDATVKFTDVTIAAYDATENTYFTQEVGDYYFKGTMAYSEMESTYWTTGALMANDAFEFNGYAAGTYLNALRAYIVGKTESTPAPKITIEEIDGSVTAIDCITTEGEAIEADGWYTVNGMRLEGAPAQKGIYIRNGKKVVIK